MKLDHHLSGAAAAIANTSVTHLRVREHAAEVALVATADDPLASAAQLAEASSSTTVAAGCADKPFIRTISFRTSKQLTRFLLQRLPGALYVERQQSRRPGTQTIQSVRFGDTQGFEAWCDEDPMRFDEPRLLAQVRREGTELFKLSPAVATAA